MNFSQTSLCHLYNIQLHLYSIQGYMNHIWMSVLPTNFIFCICISQYQGICCCICMLVYVWHIWMFRSDQFMSKSAYYFDPKLILIDMQSSHYKSYNCLSKFLKNKKRKNGVPTCVISYFCLWVCTVDTQHQHQPIWEEICWPYRAWKWCHIFSFFGHCFRQFRGLKSQEMKYFLKMYQRGSVGMLSYQPYQPFI